MEGAERAINPFDRLPKELWTEIFGRVPHLTRLQSRCVCSTWNQFLRKHECSEKPAGGVWCLAIAERLDESIHSSFYHPTRRSHLQCWALAAPPKRIVALGVTFPKSWTPDANAGGFRAGGDLAAFFQDSHYWVGNPVHGKWDKIQEPPQFGSLRNRFELVVLPGGYHIVQFGVNEAEPKYNTRRKQNFVIQVFSSSTRSWRAGPSIDRLLFRCLLDYCAVGGTVYFLGDVAVDSPHPHHDAMLLDQKEWADYHSVKVWGYNLDTDTLSLVVPAAQFSGVVYPFEGCRFSLRLHVSNRPRQVKGSSGSSSSFSQEFSITMVYGSIAGTVAVLCYHRAEQRWVEWQIRGPESKRHQEVQAIAVHPCACCGQQCSCM